MSLPGEDTVLVLAPLLGKQDRHEQWIFPSMQFTCHGMLTRWIFRGVPEETVPDACRVQLTTWRPDDFNGFNIAYERVSTTEDNTETVTVDESSFFTYKLTRPVRVQPGDVLGIEMSIRCRRSQNYDNIVALNTSHSNSTMLSYRRSFGGTIFLLDSSSVSTERNLNPLLTMIIGKFYT